MNLNVQPPFSVRENPQQMISANLDDTYMTVNLIAECALGQNMALGANNNSRLPDDGHSTYSIISSQLVLQTSDSPSKNSLKSPQLKCYTLSFSLFSLSWMDGNRLPLFLLCRWSLPGVPKEFSAAPASASAVVVDGGSLSIQMVIPVLPYSVMTPPVCTLIRPRVLHGPWMTFNDTP